MRKLIVNMHMTLDGVIQAPGRADEDARGKFAHGGWAIPYADAEAARAAVEGIASQPDLLFGRRAYEDFYAVWPKRTDSPFSKVLDNARKYVASRTLTEPLPWQNSILLKGDAAATVAALKTQDGPDLLILGCGALVQSLRQANLVDELLLSIYPLVLGSGQRLFPEGSPFAAFELVESRTTKTGVVVATYRRAAPRVALCA